MIRTQLNEVHRDITLFDKLFNDYEISTILVFESKI